MGEQPGILRVYLEALVIAVLLATFTRAFLVQGVRISSGSMEDTLRVGDYLLVNRFAFATRPPLVPWLVPTREIRRGDLLLHRHPDDPATLLVKRCVGLPGEQIEIRGGRVIVDGTALQESPRSDAAAVVDHASIRVPPDHYYVLGDRRDRSIDSRDWGAVPARLVLGRPFFVYWSWRASVPAESGPLAKLSDLFRHFLSRTRWDRTGGIVR